MIDEPQILIAGDSAISIVFGNAISEPINQKVRDLFYALSESNIDGIVEMTPTYCALLVEYDPLTVKDFSAFSQQIRKVVSALASSTSAPTFIYEIPTLYTGMDLLAVANHAGITTEEVVKIHSSAEYRIYMLGFTPGFPYLGGMDGRIETPRLQTPRALIEAGSVGIAGHQTGIYPVNSPGGWQIIGKTPLKLFDPLREQPFLLHAGHALKFKPIDQAAYDQIVAQIANGIYDYSAVVKERGVHVNA